MMFYCLYAAANCQSAVCGGVGYYPQHSGDHYCFCYQDLLELLMEHDKKLQCGNVSLAGSTLTKICMQDTVFRLHDT